MRKIPYRNKKEILQVLDENRWTIAENGEIITPEIQKNLEINLQSKNETQ